MTGPELRDWRKWTVCLTQAELAPLLGINRDTLQQWEKRQVLPLGHLAQVGLEMVLAQIENARL